MEEKYIAAIEIGSSHIRAAVGSINDQGVLTLLAVEEERAVDVVRYGVVQNVDEVSNRIKRLILRLENYQSISPRKIKSVYVAVGGRSTMTTSRQIVRQFDDEVEITSRIIDQMKDEARQTGLSERTVVDVVPKEFIVDNLECLNPVGTFGKNIRADINLVTCRYKILRNIDIAVSERQQLAINDRFVRQLSIADLVLTSDEKKLGCMLVDFGAETATASIYKNGALQYLATLPIGSRHITRDVMASSQITEERAEEIKRAIGDAVNTEPNIRKRDFDGDPVNVNNFIRARAGEIALNILEQVNYAGYDIASDIPGGIVLVGAGAKLKGFSELLAQQGQTKVRLGSIPGVIRISDTRLQDIEMIDIIALLYAASTHNPVECTEKPAPITHPDDVVDDDEEDGPGPAPIKGQRNSKEKELDAEPKKTGSRFGPLSKIFQKTLDRISQSTDTFFDDPDTDD